MRILAVRTYPDDIENSCGGTLAKFYQRGDKVITAYVINGDMSYKNTQKNEN